MLADLIIEARCTSTSNPSSVHRERERQFNSPPLDIPWFTRRRENIEEQRWKNITGAGSFRSTVSVDRQQPSSPPFPRYLRALEHRRPFSLSFFLSISAFQSRFELRRGQSIDGQNLFFSRQRSLTVDGNLGHSPRRFGYNNDFDEFQVGFN